MKDKLEFGSLGEVLSHLESSAKGIESDVATYRHQVMELTGHNPDKPVTAIDVVKIVQKLFFGDKKDA